MTEKERFRKAICWLEETAGIPRRVMRSSRDSTPIADIYRLRRENKPDVWYCAEYVYLSHYTKIRRICRS